MAGDSHILREYLVSLGFRVDGTSERKFGKNLADWDKRATNLAKAVGGVGTAVVGMVSVFAYQMEKLYYASQRTGAAVGNIKALEYAGTRIGLAGGAMTQALEGMAKAIRMNPAIKGVIEGLGIKVTGRDAGDVAKDVLKTLSAMPAWLGGRMAEEWFGISEETLTAYRNNQKEFDASVTHSADVMRMLGVDQTAAAEAGKEYMNQWREIKLYAEGFQAVLSIAVLPLMREMAGVAKEVLTDLSSITQKYSKPGGGGIMQLVKDTLDGLDVMMGFDPTFGGTGERVRLSEDTRHRMMVARRNGTLPSIGTTPGASWPASRLDNLGPRDMPEGRLPIGLRQNNPGNLRSWGDTPRQNGFANFETSEQGLSAMAGQLLRYQSRGIDTIRSIISTYAPSSENDTGAYIGNVSKATGFDADKKLDLKDMATMTALMGAMIRQENGTNPFSRATLEGAASSRGVTVHQKTDIHVSGAESPRQTAEAVANAQADVSNDIVRNNRGALR